MRWAKAGEREAIRELKALLGSKAAAERWLLQFGMRTYLAAQPPGGRMAESQATYRRDRSVVERHRSALVEILEPYSIEVRRFRRGRPSTFALVATHAPVEVAGSEELHDQVFSLAPEAETFAIACFTERRASGSAAFSLRCPTEDDRYDLAVFVLLADGERRGWLVTREELIAIGSDLAQGSRWPGFTLDEDGEHLRIRFPKAEGGFDAPQRLKVKT